MKDIKHQEEIAGYIIERKKVKNINLRIKTNGTIYISAPLNLDKYYIEQFINSKKEFIEKHVTRIKKYILVMGNLDTYKPHSYISFLGKKYKMEIISSNLNRIKLEENIIKIYTLYEDEKMLKDIVYSWYYKNAVKIFNERFEYYKNIMKEYEDIRLIIKLIKGKWGFCIPKKREIALNLELMKKSIMEIDSVIVHELSHLRYPNHSKDFYNYIDIYFKNYKEINKKLNYNV
ncbi:M48 family metallopeptidase [Caviibacter abscessus]|uniref:M48 family metallopeptidase n=1 Tax=Caviibacter abscessus TaxID=1766719 RepID=UPI00082A3D2D|nr:SprT family zinc-dependent metalloprotease [Caviibacter abscessus]